MSHLYSIGWFYWDPPRIAFTLPWLNHPVYWYGLLFISGFILGYFIANPIFRRFLDNTRQINAFDVVSWASLVEFLQSSSHLASQMMAHMDASIQKQIKQKSPLSFTELSKKGILEGINQYLKNSSTTRKELQAAVYPSLATTKQTTYFLTDRLSWFLVAGAIIGARLGAVFFYDWAYFSQHPMEIFKVWNGGLASHGGVLGVILAVFLYSKWIQKRIPQFTFLRILDFIAIPSALAISFIRLGNFVNQEILGIPTELPWGVLFGHPADYHSAIPRHPVQLYEAGAYLVTFFILCRLWKNHFLENRPGSFIALLFIFGFGSRLIIEFWKADLDSYLNFYSLQAGQILSIPFIVIGFILFIKSKNSEKILFDHNK